MAIPPEQAETASLLSRLAGTAPIETHISAVFVGAEEVLKLRKAVRLTFLDFSPLAERERTARRELELNRRLAPGLYRDVVPVTRAADGRLALGGDGAVVDWVLRMAPVPEADFLDAIAARGALTPALLADIGDAAAAIGDAARVVRCRQADRMRAVATGNAQSARAVGLPEAAVAAWEQAILAAIAARETWLDARGHDGFVRRGHGDLHLGNMCVWHGHAVPFDALEFDEDLATIDVGYEVAFVLMDLEVAAA